MDINTVWNKIKEHEGEEFYRVTGKPFKYIVYDDFFVVENIKGSRITKSYIEKSMMIDKPTPSKINMYVPRGGTYIYGIITDKRIIGV